MMKTMKLPAPMLTAMICMICMIASAAQAQSPPASNSNNSVVFATPAEQGNVFQADGSASPTLRQMYERFNDPQQRAIFRAEQRVQILKSHQDVGPALGIDVATEEKLMELLTDQQMDMLEAFYRRAGESAASAQAARFGEHLFAQADRETRQIQALRELLGEEGLERYQWFKAASRERAQVGEFNAHLQPAHRLRADQKESLSALYKEINDREIFELQAGADRNLIGELRTMPSHEDLQRFSMLSTISANEASWRRMAVADRLFRERAAAFLTAPQLETLAQMNADKARDLQRWIENARTLAGLSRDIPDEPEPSKTQPVRVDGEVRLSIKLTVNHNPPIFLTHVVDSGKPVTFSTAEGLIVEATPIQYDDNMFDLKIAYYEEGVNGKRLIGRGGQMGVITKSSAAGDGGTGSTVITGSKGYVVEMSAQVEAM